MFRDDAEGKALAFKIYAASVPVLEQLRRQMPPAEAITVLLCAMGRLCALQMSVRTAEQAWQFVINKNAIGAFRFGWVNQRGQNAS